MSSRFILKFKLEFIPNGPLLQPCCVYTGTYKFANYLVTFYLKGCA